MGPRASKKRFKFGRVDDGVDGWFICVYTQRFFPTQDTGVIQGVSEASQSVSYKAMARYQQDLADVILQDKDVESLSSFIGVDGVNSTLNNGRILINLKPHGDRDSIQKIIRRLQQNVDAIPNIKLYLQASQDLTIEDHISRTQYQFTVESANAGELDEWMPLIVDKLSTLPVSYTHLTLPTNREV